MTDCGDRALRLRGCPFFGPVEVDETYMGGKRKQMSGRGQSARPNMKLIGSSAGNLCLAFRHRTRCFRPPSALVSPASRNRLAENSGASLTPPTESRRSRNATMQRRLISTLRWEARRDTPTRDPPPRDWEPKPVESRQLRFDVMKPGAVQSR